MFWKYLLFELKLLLSNRKNWLLGIVLLLFFPLYYLIYSQAEPETTEGERRKMKQRHSKQFSFNSLIHCGRRLKEKKSTIILQSKFH